MSISLRAWSCDAYCYTMHRHQKIVKGFSPAECRRGYFHQRKGCGMVSRPQVHPPYPHLVSEVIFEPDYGNLPGVPLVEALYGQGLKSVMFEGNPPKAGNMHFELYVSALRVRGTTTLTDTVDSVVARLGRGSGSPRNTSWRLRSSGHVTMGAARVLDCSIVSRIL